MQFYDRLPDEIRENKLIVSIASHLNRKFGDGPPDVEKILWCLSELYEYLNTLNNKSHPACWFIPTNQLPGLIGATHAVNHFTEAAKVGTKVIDRLRKDISSKVYEYYSSDPSSSSLRGNWGELFNFLATHSFWPDIVTSNYDLVIEKASQDAGGIICYGAKSEVVRTLDLDIWEKCISDPLYVPYSAGLLTKLHGSVNWVREGDEIVFGGRRYLGNHELHGVIYPGFKGIPSVSPFDLLHRYFESAIVHSSIIIFIGFAFRDEYINTLLERNLGDKTLYVIDPGNVVVPASVSDRVHHIKKGFCKEAVAEIKIGSQ